MKQRQPNETDEHYIKRLEDANDGLRRQNASLTEWAGALNEAVTVLSCDGSLAFQAMAEKAGVRHHPSVTEVVRLFDLVSHPQWRNGEKIPKIEFPDDWDFDDPDAWSGDADAALNSPIADAVDFLTDIGVKTMVPQKLWPEMDERAAQLQALTYGRVEAIKEAAGFVPREVRPQTGNLKDLDADQLRQMVSDLGWLALDLAQDMHFANFMLRRDLRAACYRRVCADLYRLSRFDPQEGESGPINIKIFGAETPV